MVRPRKGPRSSPTKAPERVWISHSFVHAPHSPGGRYYHAFPATSHELRNREYIHANAYRNRIAALEAENERLRGFVTSCECRCVEGPPKESTPDPYGGPDFRGFKHRCGRCCALNPEVDDGD